jgi:DNA-binding CsgD family transcriptional regulator
VEKALALARDNDDRRTITEALNYLARVALKQGDLENGKRLAHEGLTIAREIGNVFWIVMNLGIVAWAAAELGDEEHAMALTEEIISSTRSRGDLSTLASTLPKMAWYALRAGDVDAAAVYGEDALAVATQAGYVWHRASAHILLARVAVARGDAAGAWEHLSKAIALAVSSGEPLQSSADTIAFICVACNRHAAAVTVLAAANADGPRPRGSGTSIVVGDREAALTQAHRELGNGFERTWSEGRAMSLDEAIAYALKAEPAPSPELSPTSGLSKRELEVLRLLVEGMTNQEIAATLFISPHTAANHVAHLMNKLGLDSRAAAAAWAVRHGIG